ncbi:anti-sigma factor [Streptomyces hypolithicus]
MSEDHLHAPTGAYALHALPDDEREAFVRHTRGCPACAQEARELTATAARLGSAVSVAAPADMRARVLAQLPVVRQLPPHVPPTTAAPSPPAGARRHLPRLALAACVAAATAFGGAAVWQYQEAQQAEQRALESSAKAADVADVLTAPDARTVSGAAEGRATATVIVSRGENRAVFLASGLAELADDKTYQLWFDEGGTMRPAGLLTADGTLAMEGSVDGATGMGVTVEPAGGSPRPTTTPLMLMTFPG